MTSQLCTLPCCVPYYPCYAYPHAKFGANYPPTAAASQSMNAHGESYYINNITNNYYQSAQQQQYARYYQQRRFQPCAFGLECTSITCPQSQYYNHCFYGGSAFPYYGTTPSANYRPGQVGRGLDEHYWINDASNDPNKLFDMSPILGPRYGRYGSPHPADFQRGQAAEAKETVDNRSSIYKIMRGDQKKPYADSP